MYVLLKGVLFRLYGLWGGYTLDHCLRNVHKKLTENARNSVSVNFCQNILTENARKRPVYVGIPSPCSHPII